MIDDLFRNFMESITAAMSEEEKQFVRERLENEEETARAAFDVAFHHWLFLRDGEAAKRVLLGLLRGEE